MEAGNVLVGNTLGENRPSLGESAALRKLSAEGMELRKSTARVAGSDMMGKIAIGMDERLPRKIDSSNCGQHCGIGG